MLLNVTCPGCGLLCDDILLETEPHVKLVNNTCAKAVAFFEQPAAKLNAMIKGKPASMDDAIAQAAKLLKSAKNPLFSGLSTDVAGFRAIYQLAQKTNGTLKHMNANSMQRNLDVLQSTGWQTTTLTEVKNRADVIVCIGTDIVSHNARFFERFVWTKNALFTDANAREIIYVGEDFTSKNMACEAGISPLNRHPSLLACSQADLPEITAVLHALILGKKLHAEFVAGIKVADLQAVANKLKQAKYAVLTWIAKDLDYEHAELTIQQITEIIATLNQTTRAAGLMLGGSDGDTSANNANTWLSGLSLNNLVALHDCVVWINSFNPNNVPPETDKPHIVIGSSNMKHQADVFIPVATPGLDCSGTLFRVDSAVVLPLKKVRENTLLSLGEVVQKIEAALVNGNLVNDKPE